MSSQRPSEGSRWSSSRRIPAASPAGCFSRGSSGGGAAAGPSSPGEIYSDTCAGISFHTDSALSFLKPIMSSFVVADFIPVGCLIFSGDESDHSCVIGRLDYGAGEVVGDAVVGGEVLANGAQPTSLRGTGTEGEVGGEVRALEFNSLGAVGQTVFDPVAGGLGKF